MTRYIIICSFLLCTATAAFADSVDVEYLKRECVVGEKLAFNVKITLDDAESKKIDVSSVKLNGAPLTYEVSESGTQSFTVVINGRTVRQSSGVVKNYVFSIPTTAVGPLTVPAFDVKIGKEVYSSKALTFRVNPKPTSSDLLFVTQLEHAQAAYYPAQVVRVVCKILYRNFPGSPSIEEIHMPILEHKSFAFLPEKDADREMVINQGRIAVKEFQGEETVGGKSYNVFGFRLKFRLMESGRFTFDNFIKMQVETGKHIRQRGFFGTHLVPEKVTLYADSKPVTIVVRDLPRNNVPDTFNGAIGNFKIDVIPSSDTNVKVGDPITLSIEISGNGTWEFVKHPPVHKMEAITDYFIVSSDPVAGKVSADGTRKTFLVRMRVKSKTVKEIPPIAFTYFDLSKEQYVTVQSDPVPITVFDAGSDVEVVDYSKPPQQKTVTKETVKQDVDHKKDVDTPSVSQPEPLAPIEISSNVGQEMLTDNHGVRYYRIIYAVIPYLLVCMLYAVGYLRRRNLSPEKQAELRSKSAYRMFKKSIAPLSKHQVDTANFYRDLGRGLEAFIAQRFDNEKQAVNGELITQLVESQKLSRDKANSLLKISEEIDYRRYSSAAFDPEVAHTLLKKTTEVAKKC